MFDHKTIVCYFWDKIIDMKNTTLLLLLVFLSCKPAQKAPESTAHLPLTDLVLKNAYEIKEAHFEGAPIEPSGIAIYQDTLFFISDNHDQSIFMLYQAGAAMAWKEVLRFEPAFSDIEGMSTDESGDFYLISEAQNQIIKVSKTTKKASLVGGSVKDLLPTNLQLLAENNAKLEGIVLKNDSTALLAAERSNRGIIEVQFKEAGQQLNALKLIKAKEYNTSRIGEGLRKAGTFDFAEIFYYQDNIYALDRNAQSIIQINEAAGANFEQAIWSYRNTMDTYGYKGKGFTEMGTAEGLFITDELVYVVYDNNKRSNRFFKSSNPILLVFEKP